MKLKNMIDALERRRMLADLASGVSETGTVTGSQLHTYTFDVAAGREIIIVAGDTGATAFEPTLDLLNPSDVIVKHATSESQTYMRYTTTVAGTYTLQVGDDDGSHSGSYKLTMFTAGEQGTDTDNTTGAIASGRRIAATMGPGDLDVYTIDMLTGQVFTAIATENNPGNALQLGMDIVTPNGSYLIGDEDAEGVGFDAFASQTGTYYVIVRANSQSTGVYGYSNARVPGSQYTSDPDYGQLTSGVTRDGDMPGGDVDVFYFYVEPGTAINVTMSPRNGSSLDPFLILYLPSGEQLTSAEDTISESSTYGGTYWVVARDYEADDGGLFSVTLELGSGSGASPGSTLHYTGNNTADEIIATNTNDVLSITNGNVSTAYYAPEFSQLNIDARGGNDLVDVSDLSTRIYVLGGDGEDTLIGGSGSDTLSGGASKNYLYGGSGIDRLNGSGSRDYLYGQGGDDRLYGNGGDDYMDGGGNVDRLFGGLGNDTLLGGGSNDKLYGEDGNDRLVGNAGSDILNGALGTDTADSDGEDSLVGIEVEI